MHVTRRSNYFIPPSKNRLCVLDLDHTLTDEECGTKFTHFLFENGIFEKNAWNAIARLKRELDSNKNDYSKIITEMSKQFALGLKDRPHTLVQRYGNEFAKRVKIREGVAEVLSWFRSNNFEIVLLTASPKEVADPIASLVGIKYVYALQVEVLRGKYTGICRSIMNTQGKRETLKKLVIIHNRPFIIGIGDTISDMNAYEDANLKFLMRPENEEQIEQSNKFVTVRNWYDIKNYLTRNVKCF